MGPCIAQPVVRTNIEHRPLHRGVFKGERPKGRKARLDELLQVKKKFFKDLDWLEEAKGRHAKFAKQYK